MGRRGAALNQCWENKVTLGVENVVSESQITELKKQATSNSQIGLTEKKEQLSFDKSEYCTPLEKGRM